LQGNLNKNNLAKSSPIKVKPLVKLYLYKNKDILIKIGKTFISNYKLVKDIKVNSIIIYIIRDSVNNLYFIIYLTILKLIIKEAYNPFI
jgi:hypothetical protein